MTSDRRRIYLGFEPREADAFAVARKSISKYLPTTKRITTSGLLLDSLIRRGVYWREHTRKDGRMWDVISDAPMSTEFAFSRFLTPYLAGEGWALFADGDIMARSDVSKVFNHIDERYAVMVVKHDYTPKSDRKMDNQINIAYPRKNWSSVMLFNCSHPACLALTPDVVNAMTGRGLHQFVWLKDELIGELPVQWNWLVGYSDPKVNPVIVHFTDGVPTMPGCADVPYADEWRSCLREWAK